MLSLLMLRCMISKCIHHLMNKQNCTPSFKLSLRATPMGNAFFRPVPLLHVQNIRNPIYMILHLSNTRYIHLVAIKLAKI